MILIHKDRYGRIDPFVEKYAAILSHNGIASEYVHVDAPDFWTKVAACDGFIFRFRHIDEHRELAHAILPIIEKVQGKKVFPDIPTYWHFDDKVRQYYLMRALGLPMTESWIFWEKEHADAWAEKADYPVIFKLRGGAGSTNVVKVNDRAEARRIIAAMFGPGVSSRRIPSSDSLWFKPGNIKRSLHRFAGDIRRSLRGEDPAGDWQLHKNYVYFQRFLPGNEFDIRVTIIGDRAFAFRRFVRDGDFRASGSGRIDYDMASIPPECLRIAFEVSKRTGAQSMAYDFLRTPDSRYEFCEMSYSYQDLAVYRCPGHWDRALNWHEGHLWPQYCQLIDLLGRTDLKQPEFSE